VARASSKCNKPEIPLPKINTLCPLSNFAILCPRTTQAKGSINVPSSNDISFITIYSLWFMNYLYYTKLGNKPDFFFRQASVFSQYCFSFSILSERSAAYGGLAPRKSSLNFVGK
jgi:hypothetical protein